MKKLLLFIGLLFLLSCEKEEATFCWECETTTTYSATGYIPKVETNMALICDKTYDEIYNYERSGSSTIIIKIGSTIATTAKITKCEK